MKINLVKASALVSLTVASTFLIGASPSEAANLLNSNYYTLANPDMVNFDDAFASYQNVIKEIPIEIQTLSSNVAVLQACAPSYSQSQLAAQKAQEIADVQKIFSLSIEAESSSSTSLWHVVLADYNSTINFLDANPPKGVLKTSGLYQNYLSEISTAQTHMGQDTFLRMQDLADIKGWSSISAMITSPEAGALNADASFAFNSATSDIPFVGQIVSFVQMIEQNVSPPNCR